MSKYQEALKTVKKSCISAAMEFNFGELFEEEEKALSTLQELIDKATPKKLVRYDFSKEWHCPNCGSGNGEYEGTVGTHNYCHFCGQALDWSDEDDK